MKTQLVRIGNSRGIRIPKPLIEQCRFGNEVELQVENERLIISAEPLLLARAGKVFSTPRALHQTMNFSWSQQARMNSIARIGDGEPRSSAR